MRKKFHLTLFLVGLYRPLSWPMDLPIWTKSESMLMGSGPYPPHELKQIKFLFGLLKIHLHVLGIILEIPRLWLIA